MTPIVIDLPRPPSANNLFAGKQRRYRSRRYLRWINEAGWILATQRPARITGPYELRLIVERPKRKADAENYLKAVHDLLVTHEIVEDDSLAERVSAEWGDVEGCRVMVGGLLTVDPVRRGGAVW